MDKLLKLLGIDSLNEETQAEVKTKLQDYIDVKAKELSEEKVSEEKEVLVEKYEEKFEEYKKDVTAKFSNFVDNILEEELTIPEKVLEFAKKGELYDDLIEQFKVRLGVDEGLVDEEVKGLLKEAKEEILKLRGEIDSITEKHLEVTSDAQEMAAQLYLYEKCEGLTEKQKRHVMAILEGVEDKAEIDRKFAIIVEQADEEKEDDDDEEKEEMSEEDEKEDEDDDEKEDEDDDEKEMSEADKKKGKGLNEVTKKKGDKLDEEDDSPFKQFKNQYLNTLRSNRVT
jgi:hypothetical protein